MEKRKRSVKVLYSIFREHTHNGKMNAYIIWQINVDFYLKGKRYSKICLTYDLFSHAEFLKKFEIC